MGFHSGSHESEITVLAEAMISSEAWSLLSNSLVGRIISCNYRIIICIYIIPIG